MADELYVIELPHKDETYMAKIAGTLKKVGENQYIPEMVDKETSTREQFIIALRKFTEKRFDTIKKSEVVSIMNLLSGIDNLSDDDSYLEVDKKDCEMILDGFEALKPEERTARIYTQFPGIFKQLESPKSLADLHKEAEEVEPKGVLEPVPVPEEVKPKEKVVV